jgi:uncharacterized protein (DUF433 family)
MKLPPFLTEWPYGEIMVTGHRIGLYHVLVHHNLGQSAAMLHEQFPTLSVELLQDILAFYKSNREEVDAYVSREQAAIDHQRATGKHINLAELQRRLEARELAQLVDSSQL